MKTNFKKVCNLILATTSILCATGCDNGKNDSIVIGVSGPLTGGAAVYGIAVLHSAEMAIEEINAAGGVNGYNLKLIATDDKHDASLVSTNFASLMEQGMQVSLGTVTTKPGLEFSKIAHEDGNRVFFMTPSATNDNIVQYDNGYQMCFSDNRQGKFSALYVNEYVSKETTIGILYNSSDDYSKGIYNEFKDNIDKDFTIVETSFNEENPTSLAVQANTLKDCDFIFLPIYYTPASTFMTNAIGIIDNDAIYFGCDGLDGIDTAIDGFNINTIPQEVSYLSHFNSSATSGKAKEYVDKFSLKYPGETINQFGAAAYDCVYALTGALKEIANNDPDKVTPKTDAATLCDLLINVFQGGYTFNDGATGTNVTWDTNGYVDKAAVKYVVKEKNSK